MKSKCILGSILLAGTIGLSSACWAVTPLNTTQDGRIIQGGTYYNTPGNTTTFINSQAGGLWLKAGTTVRGLEATANGPLTNHGGTLHLYAPDNVVRVDGTIDVNAIRNCHGAYLGNGGKVFIDSAYLFQNGNIFANGASGGLVQVNVAGMTLGSGAQIEAKGSAGAGGIVAVNASGTVDLRRGSLIDTSGKVIGSFDTNLINIEGSVVNSEGSLTANGLEAQSAGSRGGTIRLVASGMTDEKTMDDALQLASKCTYNSQPPTLTNIEKADLMNRNHSLSSTNEGDIVIQGTVSANGTPGSIDLNNDYTQDPVHRAGDGGTIMMEAAHDITLYRVGSIETRGANGASLGAHKLIPAGNGGTIALMAGNNISNTFFSAIVANGGQGGRASKACSLASGSDGGDGGLIALSYKNSLVTRDYGDIQANGGPGGYGAISGHGGNGGLIVFSGDTNPDTRGVRDIDGYISANGGAGGPGNPLLFGGKPGTIVSPDPGTMMRAFQQGYVNGTFVDKPLTEQTQPVELLTHAENLILLTKNGGNTNVSQNLFDRLLQAQIRSVTDPTGSLGQAQAEVINKNTPDSSYVYRNLILSSSRDNLALDLTHPFTSSGGSRGELTFPSPLSRGEGFSTLNTLSILNNGPVATQYLSEGGADATYQPTDFWVIGRNSNNLGGGRISLLANGNVENINVFGTTGVASGGSIDIATSGTFDNSALLSTGSPLHGGSIMAKAGKDIINHEQIYFWRGEVAANGGLMGGAIRFLPKNDFDYHQDVFNSSIAANGGLQGGMIDINAGRNSTIEAVNDDGIRITANGTSSALGRGGFIHINAGQNNVHNATIQANGSLKNGTVLFTTGGN